MSAVAVAAVACWVVSIQQQCLPSPPSGAHVRASTLLLFVDDDDLGACRLLQSHISPHSSYNSNSSSSLSILVRRPGSAILFQGGSRCSQRCHPGHRARPAGYPAATAAAVRGRPRTFRLTLLVPSPGRVSATPPLTSPMAPTDHSLVLAPLSLTADSSRPPCPRNPSSSGQRPTSG